MSENPLEPRQALNKAYLKVKPDGENIDKFSIKLNSRILIRGIMRTIIADTGFWLALIDQQDTYHKAARQKLREIDKGLITTWCVVTDENSPC